MPPGRPVGRPPKRKTVAGTGAARSRRSDNHADIPDEGEETVLRRKMARLFSDAQNSIATQRNLAGQLRKIQVACCFDSADGKRTEFDHFTEEDFTHEFLRCTWRILAVKKAEHCADKLVRFLGVFLKNASAEDNRLLGGEGEGADDDDVPETPTYRLVHAVLNLALKAVDAKDKVPRFRATQIIAHLVNSIEQLDGDQYEAIRAALSRRLRDKEPSIRVQAVLGYGPLLNDGDDEEDDSDGDVTSGVSRLLTIMQNDPSPEVRRAVLLNMPFRADTLVYMLERARDDDAGTRRAVYGKLLPALADFRHLSLVQREKLIRWGLRDRDDAVRKATARLFRERWIESCAQQPNATDEEKRKPGDVSPPQMEAILELLERIDVTRSGTEGGIAHDCMREFWDGRPDYRDFVKFDDDFWRELTAESAFLARSYNDYCRNSDNPGVQDYAEKIPESSKLAWFIREYLNAMIDLRKKIAELEEDSDDYEELVQLEEEHEFIVEQLLNIALTLDYADEVGRKAIYNLMRQSLALPELPEECTKLAVEVLRVICPGANGEKEFITVVLEAVSEVRDTINDELQKPETEGAEEDESEVSFQSAHSDISEDSDDMRRRKQRRRTPQAEKDPEVEAQKQLAETLIFAKCLHIFQCMMQNFHGEIGHYQPLKDYLNNLVVPSIASKQQPMVKELGLRCLALMSLNSKDLAISNFHIWLTCLESQKVTEDFKILSIYAMTDIMSTSRKVFEEDAPSPNPEFLPSLEKRGEYIEEMALQFEAILRSDADDECATLKQHVAIAASRLLLYDLLPQDYSATLLSALVELYFNPDNANDPSVQILAYCLPTFCHVSLKNARLMADEAPGVIMGILKVNDEDYLDKEAQLVSWATIANHIADWTDGRRVVLPPGSPAIDINGKQRFVDGAEEPHLELALHILGRVMRETKDAKKPLFTLLGKLHINATKLADNGITERFGSEKLRELWELVEEAITEQVADDATSRNVLVKLEATLAKRVGETAGPVDEEQGDVSGATVRSPTAQTERESDDADTVVLADKLADTQIQSDALEPPEANEQSELGDVDVDDTMLAGMQGEGTRMPLEEEEDEDEDEEPSFRSTVREEGPREQRRVTYTELDIVNSLLRSDSEDSEDFRDAEEDAMEIDG